jgi:hypothetical protein
VDKVQAAEARQRGRVGQVELGVSERAVRARGGSAEVDGGQARQASQADGPGLVVPAAQVLRVRVRVGFRA